MINVIDLNGNEGEISTFVGRLTVVMVAKGGGSLLLYCACANKQEVWGVSHAIKKVVMIKRLYLTE